MSVIASTRVITNLSHRLRSQAALDAQRLELMRRRGAPKKYLMFCSQVPFAIWAAATSILRGAAGDERVRSKQFQLARLPLLERSSSEVVA